MCLIVCRKGFWNKMDVMVVGAVLLMWSFLPVLNVNANNHRVSYRHQDDEVLRFRKHNDYYYSTISTPNFPARFSTPYEKFYVINTSRLYDFTMNINKTIVNFYMTEFFLGFEHIWISNAKMENMQTRSVTINGSVVSGSEIHVQVLNLYNVLQLRTKLHFHEMFGFNISIEIIDGTKSTIKDNNQNCTVRNCSFAGTCKSFPGTERLEFRCECLEGYHGAYCQYGPECDPDKNINYCLNGGTCSMLGYAGGNCSCPNEFYGSKCQFRRREINVVGENQDCSSTNGNGNDEPCSLCIKSPANNKDYYRYIVMFRGNKNIPIGHYENLKEAFLGRDFIVTQPPVYSPKTNVSSEEIYAQIRAQDINYKILYDKGIKVFNISKKPFNGRFRLEPELTMTKDKDMPLVEGYDLSFSCTVHIPPDTDESFIQFKWYKDDIPIQTEYSTRSIYSFENLSGLGKKFSVLMIGEVSPYDMGVFTCQVTDLKRNVQECQQYSMKVVVPPQVEVLPMYLTLVKNESRLLMCSDSLQAIGSGSHESLTIEWFKDQRKLVGDESYAVEDIIMHGGQLLRILNANQSATFTCHAKNKGGYQERSVRVELLENRLDSCREVCEVVENAGSKLKWGLTAIDQTAMVKCPKGFVGFVQRYCGQDQSTKKGVWAPSDFSRCTHERIHKINFTLHSMRHGYNVGVEGIAVLYNELEEYLKYRGENSSTLLFGEGDKFITMLVDTLDYLGALKKKPKSAALVSESDVLKLVTVVDEFIGFRGSCAHEISELVKQFMKFVQQLGMNNYNGRRISVKSEPLEEDGDLMVIDHNTSTLILNSSSTFLESESKRPPSLTFVKFSEMMYLGRNRSLISDIVSIQINEDFCFKENGTFEIQFEILETNKNKRCETLDGDKWIPADCSINITDLLVTCVCSRLGHYAVWEFTENRSDLPKAEELIERPPEWIAISGCIVCLVLCLRTLIKGLYKKIYSIYFLLITSGIITTMMCLLFIILMEKSRKSEMIYMMVTLGMESLRLWKMVKMYDMKEIFPWLRKVSVWTLLMAISLTEILPLITVLIFNEIFSTNDVSMLSQDSPVLITFGLLVAFSVLIISIAHYKTFLRVHREQSRNNNLNNNENQNQLNKNLLNTLIHLVQILCVILYTNLRKHIAFHYTLGLSSCLLGLFCTVPKKIREKRHRSLTEETNISTLSNGELQRSDPMINHNHIVHVQESRRPRRQTSQSSSSKSEDDNGSFRIPSRSNSMNTYGSGRIPYKSSYNPVRNGHALGIHEPPRNIGHQIITNIQNPDYVAPSPSQ